MLTPKMDQEINKIKINTEMRPHNVKINKLFFFSFFLQNICELDIKYWELKYKCNLIKSINSIDINQQQ